MRILPFCPGLSSTQYSDINPLVDRSESASIVTVGAHALSWTKIMDERIIHGAEGYQAEMGLLHNRSRTV